MTNYGPSFEIKDLCFMSSISAKGASSEGAGVDDDRIERRCPK